MSKEHGDNVCQQTMSSCTKVKPQSNIFLPENLLRKRSNDRMIIIGFTYVWLLSIGSAAKCLTKYIQYWNSVSYQFISNGDTLS